MIRETAHLLPTLVGSPIEATPPRASCGIGTISYCRLWLAAPLKRPSSRHGTSTRRSLLPTLVGSPIEAREYIFESELMYTYCRLWLAAPLKPCAMKFLSVLLCILLPTLVGSPIEATHRHPLAQGMPP